jgi:hypothetical protein
MLAEKIEKFGFKWVDYNSGKWKRLWCE